MMTDFLLRFFHIVPAIFLAGGVFFMWIAVLPALGTLNDDTRESLMTAVRGRWSKVVMACTALLLATGIVNGVTNMTRYEFQGAPGNQYGILVAVKLLLALAIFFVTAVLGGRSSLAEKFRQKLQFWMTVNTVLLLALIVIASTMKISKRQPKAENAALSRQVDLSPSTDRIASSFVDLEADASARQF